MDVCNQEVERFGDILRRHFSDLKTTSKKKEEDKQDGNESKPVEYCFDLEPECNLQCIDFDAVQRSIALRHNIPLACSVDAVLCSKKEIYAIEFKTGRVDTLNVNRKIYDTVLTWLENRRQTVAYTRERMTYVLVLSILSKKVKQLNHGLLGKKRPWEYFVERKDYELGKLKGWLVKQVVIMPPEFFRRYITYYKLDKLKLRKESIDMGDAP